MTHDYILIQDNDFKEYYFFSNGSCLTGFSDMNLIELSTFVNLNKIDVVLAFLEKNFRKIEPLKITEMLDDGRVIILMYRHDSLYKCIAVGDSWSFSGT